VRGSGPYAVGRTFMHAIRQGLKFPVSKRDAKGLAGRASVDRPGDRQWYNLLFAVPFLGVYTWLLVYPLVAGIRLSLYRANLFGGAHFIGSDNYIRLFRDATFLQALGNSCLFVALCVPVLVGLALALALALNRATPFAGFLRGTVFAASVLSVTVLTIVWREVLAPDGGLLGKAAAAIHLVSPAFLSDAHLVLPSLAVITVWWSLGLPMILILSALQQIPSEVFEAAALDHATPWTTFRRVTLPLLTPALVLITAYECALQFQLFGQAQLLTQGGPNGASRPMVLFIYETGFNHWDIGYAAAASQVLFAFILASSLAPRLEVLAGTRLGRLVKRLTIGLPHLALPSLSLPGPRPDPGHARHRRARLVWNGARNLFCGVMLILMLAPLVWTLFLSFRDNTDLMRQAVLNPFSGYTFANYLSVAGGTGLVRWFLNSMLVSMAEVGGVLALSSLAGYAFGRLAFPGRTALYIYVVMGLAIPDQSVILVRHHIFSALHWHNTYPGLILPGLSAPLGVVLMTETFRGLPKSLEDAARLDGASAWGVFWHILLPQTRPMLTSLGIYTFLLSWNDYWWPLISATRPSMYTLTEGMAAAQSNYAGITGQGVLMAEAVLAGLPVLIIYLIFQRRFVSAVTSLVRR
jgi:ABC-type glycerol-3-phosphate transport system permease component